MAQAALHADMNSCCPEDCLRLWQPIYSLLAIATARAYTVCVLCNTQAQRLLTSVHIRVTRSVTMAGAMKLAASAQLLAQLARVWMECTSLSHALNSLELQQRQQDDDLAKQGCCRHHD